MEKQLIDLPPAELAAKLDEIEEAVRLLHLDGKGMGFELDPYRVQSRVNALVALARKLIAERDRIHAAANQLRAERDEAVAERDRAVAEGCSR